MDDGATNATPDSALIVAPPPGPRWQEAFLDALRESGVVSYAALAAGIERSTAYRERDRDATFAERWQEALDAATDDLEYQARRLALAGNPQLLMFMLKANRPEKYAERGKLELTGANGRDLFPPKPLEAMTDDELAAYISQLAGGAAGNGATGGGAAHTPGTR